MSESEKGCIVSVIFAKPKVQPFSKARVCKTVQIPQLFVETKTRHFPCCSKTCYYLYGSTLFPPKKIENATCISNMFFHSVQDPPCSRIVNQRIVQCFLPAMLPKSRQVLFCSCPKHCNLHGVADLARNNGPYTGSALENAKNTKNRSKLIKIDQN